MEFRILGALEASDARGPIALGGRKPRGVLAMLLLDANQPVSPDALASGLWGPDAPYGAVRTVHVHVSRLRKALGKSVSLETMPAGYRLVVDPQQLDLTRFLNGAAEGRRALERGRFDEASARLQEALGEWRGNALADLADEPFAAARIWWLEEERLNAIETWFESELRAGHHQTLVAELARAVSEHPKHERFTEQLMIALYRCDRQSDALAAYQALRALLVAEEGSEPSEALQATQTAVLHHDPALNSEPAVRGARRAPSLAVSPLLPRTRDEDFFGRAAPLAQLRSHWRESRAGETRLVLLFGDAGIGKTRLASRFANEAHADGGAVLYGRADEEALLPYQPFAEALRHLVRSAGDEFSGDVAAELSILGAMFPGLLPGRGREAAPVDRDTFRYQVFDAVVATLTAAARRWPLLVVLDDLHWADKPTLLLLRHLLRHAEGTPMLVVGNLRDVDVAKGDPRWELLHDLARECHSPRIDLTGLDAPAIRALAAQRLTWEPSAGLVSELQHRTGGNAFFVEETLRTLDGGPQLADEEAIARLGVPGEVAEFILRRVRRLPGPAEDVLTMAAVVGSRFDLKSLNRLVDADEHIVLQVLKEGVEARLLVEATSEVFTFAHAHVRDALYKQLLKTEQVRLHLRVAAAVEDASRRDEPVNPAELAHHYLRAYRVAEHRLPRGCIVAARAASLAAGRRAAELFAYEEAVQHYRDALALFEPHEEAERCDALLALGRVQWHMAGDEARATFFEAAECAERRGAAGQLARAALGLGERWFEVTYLGARYDELLKKALALIGPEDRALRALLLSRRAVNIGYPNENADALAASAEAVEIARDVGKASLLGAVLTARHVTLLDVEHIEDRLQIDAEIASLSEGHAELRAEHHHWRMYDRLGVGDLEGARAELEALDVLARKLGQPVLRSLAAGAQGLFAELAGDLEVAEQHASESLRQAQIARTGDAMSAWASQMFALRRHQGRAAEMAGLVEKLATTGGHHLGWRSAWGLLCIETGDQAGARRAYAEEMRDGPAALPRGMFRLTRLALLSELCATLGFAEGAQALYAALAPYAEHNVVVAYCTLLGPVERYLARLAETFGDGARAADHAGRALERVREMNAPLLAQELEQRYEALAKDAKPLRSARSRALAT